MNSINVGNQIDDDELEDELDQLQQEQLDEQMLKTGTVPVSDQIQRMPAVANGERKEIFKPCFSDISCANSNNSQRKGSRDRGRRRGSRAQEAPGRDGYVRLRLSSGWSGCSESLPVMPRRCTHACIGLRSREADWGRTYIFVFRIVNDLRMGYWGS